MHARICVYAEKRRDSSVSGDTKFKYLCSSYNPIGEYKSQRVGFLFCSNGVTGALCTELIPARNAAAVQGQYCLYSLAHSLDTWRNVPIERMYVGGIEGVAAGYCRVGAIEIRQESPQI